MDAYSDPPAIVRQADDPVQRAPILPGSDSTSAQRTALSRLANSLRLDTSPALTHLLTTAAVKETATLEHALERRNSLQKSFHPLGTAPGWFENTEGKLTYRVLKETPLVDVVCKLSRTHDPTLLTPALIDELVAANQTSPQVIQALQRLRQLVIDKASGAPVALESVQAPTSLLLFPPKGDQVAFSALHTQSSLDLVKRVLNDASGVISDAERSTLANNQSTLEVTLLFLETSALRWSTRVDAATTLFQAAQGRIAPVAATEKRIEEELRPFEKLAETATRISEECDRSGRTDLFTNEERDQVVKISLLCRHEFLEARLEASLASAWLASASDRHNSALKHYSNAILYGEVRHREDAPEGASQWNGNRENILEQVRNCAASYATAIPPAKAAPSFKELEGALGSFFRPAEQFVVLAQSIIAARRSLLAEAQTSETVRTTRFYEKLEATCWRRSLAELGVDPTSDSDKQATLAGLTEKERELAHTALTGLLVDALERGDGASRAKIGRQLTSLVSFEPDLTVRERWSLDTKVTVAGYAFNRPERFVKDPSLLGVDIPQNLAPRELSRRLLASLFTTHSQCTARVAELAQRGNSDGHLAVAQLLEQRCLAALNHGLEEEMVAAPSSAEKQALYQQLATLNDLTREREMAAIKQFEQELSAVRSRLEKLQSEATSPLDSSATMGLLRRQVAYLESQISRWNRSIALTTVVQARAALRANDAELLVRARAAIDSIPPSVATSPSGKKLLDTFRSQHESHKLIAACKQFLFESVRDNPLTTLLLMIGAGASGAAAAWAAYRPPSSGFMLASSLLLGGKIAWCLFTGAVRIAAAYATGLSYSTPFLSGLDVVYVTTDFAQALLIFQAFWALYGERNQPGSRAPLTFPTLREIPSFLVTEAAALARLARAQMHPLSPGLWLVGIPVAAGIYQIASSPRGLKSSFNRGLPWEARFYKSSFWHCCTTV